MPWHVISSRVVFVLSFVFAASRFFKIAKLNRTWSPPTAVVGVGEVLKSPPTAMRAKLRSLVAIFTYGH